MSAPAPVWRRAAPVLGAAPRQRRAAAAAAAARGPGPASRAPPPEQPGPPQELVPWIDVSRAPVEDREELRRCVAVVPDFVSAEEERALVEQGEAHFRSEGMGYARGPGWATGGCIDLYREYDSDPDRWTGAAAAAVSRLRRCLTALLCAQRSGRSLQGLLCLPALASLWWGPASGPLPHAGVYPGDRVIDLCRGGRITPHVDDQDSFGALIFTVNLLSPCVVRFRAVPRRADRGNFPSVRESPGHADCLVPRRALYAFTGLARYGYTHEVLGGDAPRFVVPAPQPPGSAPAAVERGRRVSLVCREAGPSHSGRSAAELAAVSTPPAAAAPVGPGTHWPTRDQLRRELPGPGAAEDLMSWMGDPRQDTPLPY
eukprot:TRINITY_DN12122_c1_g6_i1.p1 TRINITY_DN12122_c1_g6~~TRINITY_DN12122_c1_g6_i1.p1  ORF type:complete len:372 (+),score=83.24 TRINITY_DN12122_c1_g6_i1:67-1182(+)